MLERLTRITKAIKMIANDKSAVIAAIGTFGDDFFTENAKRIRKGMSGVGTARNLSEDDIAYTLQEAVNTAFDPNAKWFTMKADNGMPFPCKADAVKAIVAYTENVDESGFADKVNRALEGGIGHNVPGYNEVDSELLKQVFGGEYAQLENNNDNIIKFIRLIPMVPKHQEQHERMQYMNDYAQRAKLIGLADACRIVADNKEAIREITSERAGMDVSAVVEKAVCGDTCKANDKCGKDSCNTQDSCDVDDGGAGSGNWGHKGRKGLHGGSAKGGGKHNRSAYSEAFSAEQGSESLEGVSAPWINKSGRKGWGQGYVTAKNDWVNRLSGEKNTKADKLIRKWASKPPQDEKARASYDPIASAEKNITENGTTPERWDMLQLKKEARMFDKRFQKLYDNLTLGQQMAYDMITGRADVIDQNTGEVITEQEDKDLQKLTPHEKNLLMDLEQRMLGGLQKDSKKLDELAQSLQEKYGMKPQPKEEPKPEQPEVEEPKTQQPKAQQHKAQQHKAQQPKAQQPKEEPKSTEEQEPKDEQPKTQQPKVEQPKEEQPKAPSEAPWENKVDFAKNSNLAWHAMGSNEAEAKPYIEQYMKSIGKTMGDFKSVVGSSVPSSVSMSQKSAENYLHNLSNQFAKVASAEDVKADDFIPFVNRYKEAFIASGVMDKNASTLLNSDTINGLNEQQKKKVDGLLKDLGIYDKPSFNLATYKTNGTKENCDKMYELLTTISRANGDILPKPQTEQQEEARKQEYKQYIQDWAKQQFETKQKEAQQKISGSAKKFASTRTAVQSATSLKQVNDALKAHGFKYAKFGNTKSIKCAKNCVSTVLGYCEKVPGVSEYFQGFQSSSAGWQAAIEIYMGSGKMNFKAAHTRRYQSDEQAQQMKLKCIQDKHWPAGLQHVDMYTLTATHESGHVIHNYLKYKYKMNIGQFVGEVFKQVSGTSYPSYQYIKDNLSSYATTNEREKFAQMFAEAMLSKNPRPIAQTFKKKLQQFMKDNGVPNTLFND